MISVFIVDDHPLVADGLSTMLKTEKDITVIGVAKTGADALKMLEKNEPDIILLDINLPDINGLDLCEKIKNSNPHSKILMLTSIDDLSIITQSFSKKANGYLLKDIDRTELLRAIDTVLEGKNYISISANQKLVESFDPINKTIPQMVALTRREKEILLLLDQGFNGPTIAEQLCLSNYTIETHRKNLMQKLGSNTTQMLLNKAREQNLI
ncbi:MAG: response regulator transcription factor [Flavobacteriaceae bacterium]|nr:response regulator transcription factor [Mangrovimonas sp.]MCB0433133.1 response regulator transcription factor [Mangrovimonas sp.]MCB0436405.1 response regulator transcription factor [Mangrovimonas sp.]MCB0437767.1 response regulator transcription factor [Mangrovimonas sp.]HPF97966.1 response regulator transcription factor [Mangrovimonas sp.]